ncbi:MAG TPA: AAA family ATPase [Thermomicrobiaceae bacterium]|nr:AAA family ATPase [Thermomicrobiaceae bacterium]
MSGPQAFVPEAVIFVGLQAAGKTTFYVERFFSSHVRVSLDLLRTRYRERVFLDACLQTRQPFVVDNTNPTVAERARYLEPARAAGFRTIGYSFVSDVAGSIRRNEARESRWRVPRAGIYGTRKRLQPPTYAEGFDQLFEVRITAEGEFVVLELPRE